MSQNYWREVEQDFIGIFWSTFRVFFSLVFTGFLDWIILIQTWLEYRFPLYKLDGKGLGQTSNFSWEVPSWKGRRLAQLSSSELVCRAVIKRRGGGGGISPGYFERGPRLLS